LINISLLHILLVYIFAYDSTVFIVQITHSTNCINGVHEIIKGNVFFFVYKYLHIFTLLCKLYASNNRNLQQLQFVEGELEDTSMKLIKQDKYLIFPCLLLLPLSPFKVFPNLTSRYHYSVFLY